MSVADKSAVAVAASCIFMSVVTIVAGHRRFLPAVVAGTIMAGLLLWPVLFNEWDD